MEQMVVTLPEDLGQVCEEGLQIVFHNFLLLLVDEGENGLTGAIGIRPFFHLESIPDLRVSQLKQIFLAIWVFQLDREWNPMVDMLRVLLGLDKLLEMAVESVSQFLVLTVALVLKAEGEQILGDLVVLFQEF
jgi:hypothetical protein